MKRRGVKLIVAAVIAVGLGFGAFRWFVGVISDPAPPTALVPAVVGARADHGHLVLALGEGCPRKTTVTVVFNPYDWPARVTLGFQIEDMPERLDLHSLPPGTAVTTGLPPGFDWRSARDAVVEVSDRRREAHIDLSVLAGSSGHPADVFYFGETGGWSTPASIDARVGSDLVTICTA